MNFGSITSPTPVSATSQIGIEPKDALLPNADLLRAEKLLAILTHPKNRWIDLESSDGVPNIDGIALGLQTDDENMCHLAISHPRDGASWVPGNWVAIDLAGPIKWIGDLVTDESSSGKNQIIANCRAANPIEIDGLLDLMLRKLDQLPGER